MSNYDYSSPRYGAGTTKLRAWDTIKIITQYLALFVMTVYGCHLYSGGLGEWMLPLLVVAGISSIVAYFFSQSGDTEGSVESIRRNLFIYNIASIGGYFLISNLASIDESSIAASFGLLNGAIGNVVKGYLPIVTQMVLLVSPITHIFYEIKRIYTYNRRGYGSRKRERTEALQRTIVK
jgi:hypothetical protein